MNLINKRFTDGANQIILKILKEDFYLLLNFFNS